MTCARVIGVSLLAAVTTLAGVAVQADQAAVLGQRLAPEQIDTFLRTARIVSSRPTSVGVTGSRRATLTDGVVTHDAHVQVVDEFKAVYTTSEFTEVGFRDSYRFNVAAYQLARLLEIDNVPVSVVRAVDRQPASVTWWVDDVAMDERERQKRGVDDPDVTRRNHYQYRMRVFDELIANRDRNQGNVLYTSDWTLWMIDHTRAFRSQRTLAVPARLQRIEQSLFDKLQALTPDTLEKAVAPHLDRQGRDALLARRDAIVAHLRARIAQLGADGVLYTFRP